MSELSKFELLGSVNYHGTSAMREDQPVMGCHFGGNEILWSLVIDQKVEPLVHPNNRLCCVNVTFTNNVTALIINTYLPCDEIYSGQNYDVLITVLNDITYILQNYSYDFTMQTLIEDHPMLLQLRTCCRMLI